MAWLGLDCCDRNGIVLVSLATRHTAAETLKVTSGGLAIEMVKLKICECPNRSPLVKALSTAGSQCNNACQHVRGLVEVWMGQVPQCAGRAQCFPIVDTTFTLHTYIRSHHVYVHAKRSLSCPAKSSTFVKYYYCGIFSNSLHWVSPPLQVTQFWQPKWRRGLVGVDGWR